MGLIIGFVISIIATIVSAFFSLPIISGFILNSKLHAGFIVLNILLFFILPLVALVMFLSNFTLKKNLGKSFRAGLWSIWLVNLVCLVLSGVFVGKQFRDGTTLNREEVLSNMTSDTLYIEMLPNAYRESLVQFGPLNMSDNKLAAEMIRVNLRGEDINDFIIDEEIYSRGSSLSDAQNKANVLQSEYELIGNTIQIPAAYYLERGEKWRGQHIHLNIKVPKGKFIKFVTHPNRINNLWRNRSVKPQPRHYGKDQIWQHQDGGFVCTSYLSENNNENKYSFQNFSKVRIEGHMNADIRKGDKFEVKVVGMESEIESIRIEKVGETLNVEVEDHHHGNDHANLVVTMPNLNLLDMMNTNEVVIRSFEGRELKIINEGSTDFRALDIDIDKLNLNFNKGKADIRGTGKRLKATLYDCNFDAGFYTVETADLQANRMRRDRFRVAVSDTLFQKLKDTSGPKIDGNPIIIDYNKNEDDNN